MLRVFVLVVIISYTTSAPLLNHHNEEPHHVRAVKRSNEQVLYGNHQNDARQVDSGESAAPPGGDLTGLIDREASMASAVAPAENIGQSSPDLSHEGTPGGASASGENTFDEPLVVTSGEDGGGEEESLEDIEENDDKDRQTEDLTEDEEDGEAEESAESNEVAEDKEEYTLHGLLDEKALSKLKEIPALDNEATDKTMDALKNEFAKLLDGNGELTPEVYEELRKYAALASMYSPMLPQQQQHPQEDVEANTGPDDMPADESERQQRSVNSAAYKEEDMVGGSMKLVHSKDRSKRDLREDGYVPWSEEEQFDDEDDYPEYVDDDDDVQPNYPLPGLEEYWEDVEYDEDKINRDEEVMRELLDEEREREFAEKARERLALLDVLYEKGADNSREVNELQEQPYENIFYHGQPGVFVPQKRQYLSLGLVGTRKRSSGFYPYSEGTDSRWRAMMASREEKRNQEAMYERLLNLAEQLRGPGRLDWQAIKKK